MPDAKFEDKTYNDLKEPMPLTNVLVWPPTYVNIVANLPLKINDGDDEYTEDDEEPEVREIIEENESQEANDESKEAASQDEGDEAEEDSYDDEEESVERGRR